MNCGAKRIADDPALASRIIRQGLRLEPGTAIGWYNLGLSYHQERKIEASIRAYQHALLQPKAPRSMISKNLWKDLLLAERWHEGWQLMEERSQLERFKAFAQALGPSWQGAHDPLGSEQGLMVLSEQGLGDTLMFIRFAVLLQQMGIKVKLLCQPALVELLQTCSDLKHVEGYRQPNSSDQGWRWVPLMSLPRRIPWLTPPWPNPLNCLQGKNKELIKRRELWQTLLSLKPGHRLIGLHWQGNPKHEGSLYSRQRSIPLQAWNSLRGRENNCVEFVALQKGAGLEQWSRSSPLPYVAGQEKFNANFSMLDSAAVISMCHTVISADSCVVHLAGLLGVQTWVALRHTPDWRWGLQEAHTPWYPTLKLFRQPAPDDWGSVVQKMAQQLR